MRNIINFCVKHPLSVLMTVIAIVLCGSICVFSINIDFLPKVGERYLLVTTEFEGIPANEMKKLVTVPIEDSSASLKGIKNIESVTRDGISLITIELHWNTDIDLALIECREIIDTCFGSLPTGCSKPLVKIYNPNQSETFKLCIKSLDGDLKYCRYIAQNDIKSRLQRIDGVATVSVAGGEEEEVHVIVNMSKMESSGLSLQNISDILAEANFEYPAGVIVEGNKELVFKTNGLYKNNQEIENTPLISTNDGFIRLSDIAYVEDGIKEKETFFIYNGEESVCIGITKKTDASPVSVSKNIKKEIANLNYLYGNFFTFELIDDESVQLLASLRNLLLSAFVGIVITVFLLTIFLKTAKTALLAASMIPLSIIFSIISLMLFGRSINILSLSGIAVGIGMVVDPATVVIENIHKKLKNNKNIESTVTDATEEVSLSLVGSSLTTIIVFIPFFFLNGLTGKLFSDLAICVISSISFSCILAFTYIPAAYVIISKSTKKKIESGLEIKKIEKLYYKSLSCLFERRKLHTVCLFFILIIGIVLVLFLRKELFPINSSDNIVAELFFEEGTSLTKIEENAISLYNELSTHEEISKISILGGIDSKNYDKLSNPELRNEYMQVSFESSEIKESEIFLENLLKLMTDKYVIHNEKDFISSVMKVEQNSYLITGDDEDFVLRRAKALCQKDDIIIPESIVVENIFCPDRTACSRFNIGTINTAIFAHNTLEGVYSTYIYREERRLPVLVKFPEGQINTVEQLLESNILVDKTVIPLKTLGKFEQESNEKIIYRNNRKDSKIIKISKKRNLQVSNDIFSIEKKQIEELFGNAIFLLVIIIFLLYFVMGAQFESFVIPIFMLLALPPAFSGAFLGLFICNQSININSIIALVVLFGISVNNAIILYEAVKQLDIINRDSVIKVCVEKLRVILLTTLTTVFALLPFAIDPLHKNSQSSMSIAIIFGLLFSLVIILFIIPPILQRTMYKRNKK